MKILMCTDGSPSAHEAVRFGGLIARALGASVTLLAVSRSAEPEARAAEILQDCEPLLKGVGIRPRVMTRTGMPADEIISEAEENRYNLVVIGSHGARGLTRFVMGSTAYQIVDHMPIDTLVVRGKRPALRRVLICTAAQMDERAVEVGGEWARAAGAEVTLLHVLTPLPSIYLGLPGMEEATEELLSTGSPAARHLDAILSRLLARGVKAQLAVRRGFMPDEVLATAQREDSDLIVVGSLAHTGLHRLILGCTADKIVKHADRPVLVVRTGEGAGRRRPDLESEAPVELGRSAEGGHMYRTILVPLDGSAFGERALPMATALARATGAGLVLVRAAWATVTPGMDATEPQVRAVEECKTYLGGVAQWLADAGFDADIAVPYGQPADGILLEIELRRADLVVMCTHGRSGLGRWIYGSVAEAVLAHSPIPIIFVRPTGRPEALPPVLDHPHLLVPLDGSPFAEAALPHATALARVLDGTLHLMRVATPPPSVPTLLVVSAPQPLAAQPVMQEAVQDEEAEAENYLAAISGRVAQEGLRVQTVARFGLPAEAILGEARALGAGLIVMATHGRTGLGRLLLGSVALEVLQRDVVPLLLVRPKDLPRPGSE